MRMTKPGWVRHGGAVINSIDIQPPHGERVATCGLDAQVCIWNMKPILDGSAEEDETISRLLCTLAEHRSSVNCVRWAPDGKLLASGSTDAMVILYAFRPGPAMQVFGSSSTKNVENWTQIKTLMGHREDVIDVAWSPDGAKIASGSVDNKIIIWDSESFDIIHTLEGHEGYVQGLSWDPAAMYLASASNDQTVRIWRVSDGVEQKKIDAIITQESFFRRLCWAPDGRFLSFAAVSRDSAPCAVVVERDNWKAHASFVGHAQAIVAVRFSPGLYSDPKKSSLGGEEMHHMCCAVASIDGNISVWSTAKHKKPKVIVRDFFQQAVLDAAWSADGTVLMACSMDGSVVSVSFESKELGTLLSSAERSRIITGLFGDPNVVMSLPETPAALPESTTVPLPVTLQPRKAPRVLQTTSVSSSNPVLNDRMSSSLEQRMTGGPQPAATQLSVERKPVLQTENRRADGRRRIRPQLVTGSSNQPEYGSEVGTPPTKIARVAAVEPSVIAPPVVAPVTTVRLAAPRVVRLEAPDLGDHRRFAFVLRPPTGKDSEVYPSVTVDVDMDAAAGTPKTKIECSLSGHVQWKDALVSPASLVKANHLFVAIACDDGTLYLLSAKGRRLIPCLIIGKPAFLILSLSHLLAVCCDSNVWMWHLESLKCVFHETIAPILAAERPKEVIERCAITPAGAPIIELSSHHAFTFSPSLGGWVRVADDHYNQSAFFSVLPVAGTETGADKEVDVLASIQQQVVRTIESQDSSLARSMRGSTVLNRVEKDLVHFENQIVCAEAVQSPKEYRRWLLAYVKYCCHHRLEGRMRDLFLSLKGPHSNSRSNSIFGCEWDPSVLSLSKHALLNEALGIVKQHVHMQRLLEEFGT